MLRPLAALVMSTLVIFTSAPSLAKPEREMPADDGRRDEMTFEESNPGKGQCRHQAAADRRQGNHADHHQDHERCNRSDDRNEVQGRGERAQSDRVGMCVMAQTMSVAMPTPILIIVTVSR